MNLPRIQPTTPTRLPTPFDHPDWLLELKHDAYRAVAYVENGNCELVSRKQNVFKSFAPLCAAVALCPFMMPSWMANLSASIETGAVCSLIL